MRGATPLEVMGAWVNGMWSAGLIRFGFQAMFMLVLGHVLALALPCGAAWTKPSWGRFKPAMGRCQNRPCHGPWLAELGLGLVGGAILVRGVMDMMRQQDAKER